LRVLQWNGAGWDSDAFTFNSTNNGVLAPGLTNLSAFIVAQLSAPPLTVQSGTNGLNIHFTPFANVSYTLQRSTNLLTWAPITTVAPNTEESLILQDPAPPPNQAFYRLLVKP
jgi:hypothetical protein